MINVGELERINSEVNSLVLPRYDIDKYRTEDFWADATIDGGNEGDCEDYAIAKLRRLIAVGAIPNEEVKIALCWVKWPQGYHAVCAAKADGKWFVLDNLAQNISEFARVPYTWDVWGLNNTWHKIQL